MPPIEQAGNKHTTDGKLSMRLALYFNPNAGVGTFDAADIAGLLRAGGDEVRVFTKGRDDIDEAIECKPDVLVAAGGDGTVARAATELWKRRSEIALFLLPMGTSNNIAWTLGVTATPPVLARAMANAAESWLDIGIASAAKEQSPFVEAVGFGFFSDALRRAGSFRQRLRIAIRELAHGSVAGEALVQVAAFGIAKHLRGAAPRRYTIVADGLDYSGEYVAVEAMNIAAIGPRTKLAPGADPGDGALDLVLIRQEDREPLAHFIESHESSELPTLARHRVNSLEVRWTTGGGHLDDEVWPSNGRGPAADRGVNITIGGAIRLLLPRV